MTEGSSMLSRLIGAAMILVCGAVVAAQGPTYNLGRTPTEDELHPADAAIGPDGEGLPRGRGTAKEGARVWIARGCASCHGSTGLEGPGPRLLGRTSGGRYPRIADTVHPFAPLIWSYINQMMPLDLMQQQVSLWRFSNSEWPQRTNGPAPCCLTADEGYSMTAYLLYLSGIIKEDDVMDAKSLPQIQMPNRDAFNPPPFLDSEWKPGLRQAEVK